MRQLVLKGAAEPTTLEDWDEAAAVTRRGIDGLRGDVQGYIAVQISTERTVLWRQMAEQLDQAAANIDRLRTDVETQFRAIRARRPRRHGRAGTLGDRRAQAAYRPHRGDARDAAAGRCCRPAGRRAASTTAAFTGCSGCSSWRSPSASPLRS